MALTQQQINLLEFTPQGYRLKGTGGAADKYYEQTPLGYNEVGTPLPAVTPTPQPFSLPRSTAVYTGQIVPQTSLPPIDQIAKPSGLTKYDATGQKVDATTGRPIELDASRGAYYYTDTPNKWWDQMAAPTVAKGPIPVSQIQPSVPVDIKTSMPVISTAGSLVAGAGETSKSLQRIIDSFEAAKATPEQEQFNALNKRIQELIPKTGGQAEALASEESARGVETLKNTYANLNSQILTKTAEYKQLNDQFGALSVANQGKPITMSSIIGNERQINNQQQMMLNAKASDIGLLQAQALGLQGQIEAAQESARHAVELKYAPIIEELKIRQVQLETIRPILEAQEKKQAALLAQEYKRKESELSTQIANEKDKNSTLLNQIQAYPDAGITLNDTIESANAKITANSKIYREKVRPPVSSLPPAGTGELTPKQTSVAIQLSNSLKTHPAYTDMLDISTGISGVQTGLSQKNGFGDITAINSFQRIVDPGATVREGDIALIQSASGFIDKVLSDYPIAKLQKGDKLPDAVRARMLKTAKELYETRRNNYESSITNIKKLAEANVIPFEYVGTDFAPLGAQIGGGSVSNTGFSIAAPDGKTYTFPDQKSLNAFKQKAGL